MSSLADPFAGPGAKIAVARSNHPIEPGAIAQALFQTDRLIESELCPEEFFPRLLTLLVKSVGGLGGHLWQPDNNQVVPIARSGNPSPATAATEQQHAHACITRKTSRLSPLGPSDVNGEKARCCLVAPLRDHNDCIAVVSLICHAEDAGASGVSLQLVAAILDRLQKHYQFQHYRHLALSCQDVNEAKRLSDDIGKYLNTEEVATTVVNRLRFLFGVDRVSLSIQQGSRNRVIAISNQAVFDRRSEIVKRLQALSCRAARAEQELWYPDASEPFAPSLRKAIDHYVDLAGIASLALIPLYKSLPHRKAPDDIAATIRQESKRECIGVLVVEGIDRRCDPTITKRKWEHLRTPISNAFAHARQYDELFLMPLWRKLGNVINWYRGHTRRTAALTTLAIVIPLLVLSLVQVDFKLRGEGVIQPAQRQHVYAEADGTVDQILFVDGQQVRRGDLLMRLKNPELSAQIAEVDGQRREAKSQLETLTFQRVTRSFSDEREERELIRMTVATEARIAALTERYELLQESRAMLQIESPISGQVVTWDTRQRLQDRPVQRGQRLITVARPKGPWEVELRVPDQRAGYLLQRWNEDQERDIAATFVLASDSAEVYRGTVAAVAPSTNLDDDENQNVVRVRIRLPDSELARMRMAVKPGTSVTGHVHCGRSSLGYSKFYEFFDWSRRIWFKFLG